MGNFFCALAAKVVTFPPKSYNELDFSTFVFKLTIAY